MKLLVDMNLSPSWVDRLAGHGFEAVHWFTLGAATAADSEILTWANEHGFVVITNDLDFSAILAASARATPSVVQIRSQDLLSDEVVSTVIHALDAHRDHIERGALLSIDEAATRVGVLPLRLIEDPTVTLVALTVIGPSRLRWLPVVWTLQRGTGWRNQNSGAPFPG